MTNYFHTVDNKIRNMGFGIGLRRRHFGEIFDNNDGIDVLEITSENFMKLGGKEHEILTKVKEHFPLVAHGVSMSIGGPDPLDEEYLTELIKLVKFIETPYFSDHLSYSSAFGVEYHDLIPLPFSKEAVNHVVPRIKQVQDMAGLPFLVENPSYYVEMPGAEMSEIDFLLEIVEKADCGVLLDVNNVFVNASNHGYDPKAYIDAIPRERVLQYHIAGHFDEGEFIIDTHGADIIDEVFKLYEYAIKHTGPVTTIIERDFEIPPLSDLIAENKLVRAAGKRALEVEV